MTRINKLISIDKDNAEWLQNMYPKNFSGTIDLLIEKFRAAHTKTKEDYAIQGAEELKRALEDGAT